jgi:hypothetical protein
MMRLVFLLLMCFVVAPRIYGETPDTEPTWGELPLVFEANVGQWSADVHYLARADAYDAYVTDEGMMLDVPLADDQRQAVYVSLVDSHTSQIAGETSLTSRSHYMQGDTVHDVAHYGAVRYADVYAGIDARFYGNQAQLQYDFILQPHADVNQIALHIAGTDASLTDDGDISLALADGRTLTMQAPYSYQVIDGILHEVESAFVLDGAVVRFAIGDYDTDYTLIIDPLVYSTYVGGNNLDESYAVAVDATGAAYIAGYTYGNFPTTAGVYDGSYAGNVDAFVTKLNPAGTALVYSTYIGGSGIDIARDLAIDATGAVYITGETTSSNYPRRNAYDNFYGGGYDVFVTKLNPVGDDLVYSTYLGASNNERGLSIAVDASGSAYVTGVAQFGGFPTTLGAYDRTYNGGNSDVFVTKFTPDGTALDYSTYIGGASDVEEGFGIAVDGAGSAYVTGYTESNDFPTTAGAYDTTYNGGNFQGDGFVSKLSADGSALLYGTFLGGNRDDFGMGIVVDATGAMYITGYTDSSSYPTTAGALRMSFGGGFADAFVSKLSADGTALAYSTFLGGSETDRAYDIALNPYGEAHIVGYTLSGDFPVTAGAYDVIYAGVQDVFLTRLSATGDSLVYGSFVGGTDIDYGYGIALDPFGVAYLTGETRGFFPTSPIAYDTTFNGIRDAFVTKLVTHEIVIAFDTLTSSAPEAVGMGDVLRVTTTDTRPTMWDISVDVLLTGGTATSPDDYTVAGLVTLTIPAGTPHDALLNLNSILSVVDDMLVEPDETIDLLLQNPAPMQGVSLGTISTHTHTILNDDAVSAGFTLSTTTLNTTESGGTDTFTVVLDAQPTADIAFTITSTDTSEGMPDVSTLTFTSLNWDTPQTITVTGTDDTLIDGDIPYIVQVAVDAVNTLDVNFASLPAQDVNATNVDDDTAGFTLSTTTLSTTEAGGTDTFTVVLDAQPSADVVFTITSNDTGEGVPDVATLTFTSTDWDTPQTVTIMGADDTLIDGDIPYIVQVAIDSVNTLDVNFTSLPAQDVNATNADDDTAGFTLDKTTLSTTEAGGADTFTVVLDAQPIADVLFTVTSNDTTEGTPDVSTLTFTPTNWNTPQTITVTGADDTLIDGDIPYVVQVAVDTVNTLDVNFVSLPAQDVNATNVDDDTAGFTLNTTTLNTTEAGGTDTFTVVLDAQPSADVVFTIASNDTTEGTPDVSTLTFTPTNWDTPQTITVMGADDTLIDGDIPYIVQVAVDTVNTLDANFASVPAQDVNATNADDDVAGFTLSAITLNTTEAGGSDTFAVVLNAQPTADVVFTITSNDTTEGTPDVSTLTFTSTNWNTPQTITVTGADDTLIDGYIPYVVQVAIDTVNVLDANFATLPAQDVNATNADDDTAGFTLSATTLSTTEAGGADTFTIVLDAQPSNDVVFTITSNDTSEGTPDVSTLTFTSTNWNTPQTITVTGADDTLIDGDIPYTVQVAIDTVNTLDANFTLLPVQDVNAINADDDTAGFTLDKTMLSTTEAGGADTFTVVLDAEPTSDVVFTVTSSDTSEGVPDVSTLTFTPANWDTPQTVTVTGTDDTLIDGDIPYIVQVAIDSANTLDANFTSLPAQDVSATNADDDTAGFTLSATTLSTTEAGGVDTFTVVLDAQPIANVVFTVTSNDTSEGTPDVSTLTFAPANWNTPQTVTVTGTDDTLIDGDIPYIVQVAIDAVNTLDANFASLPAQDVNTINADDDVAGFTLSATILSTTEAGGADTFTVVLDAQLIADVVFNVTSNDTTEGTLDVSTLIFTPTNWDTPQTITVTGADDTLIDGDIPYIVEVAVDTVNTLDANFALLPAQDVNATNADDDTAGFTLDKTTLSTTEAGGTDTFTVVLDSQPSNDVVFTISSNDTSEGTPDVSTLTFTPTNWDTLQTITVTGADDTLIDGDIPYIMQVAVDTVNTSDANFASLPAQDVNATNADDDTAGFTVSTTTLSTTEAGGTDTFTVVLDAQPSADVVFTISSNDTSEGTPDVSTPTFAPANWDTPQTITVIGADDTLVDGDIPYIMQVAIDAVNTLDSNFTLLPVQDVNATNADDDTAGFTVNTTTLSTTEAGDTDTFTVVLDAQPTADVVFTISSNDTSKGTPNVSTLTFTPANWNTPQTITVTGADDTLIDGNVPYIVQVTVDTVNTLDANFASLLAQDVNATNADDDTAGFTLNKTTLSTNEAGGTDTFTVVLNAQPSNNVAFTISSNDTSEGTTDVSTLTFTPTNWDTPQTITVTGADDKLIDGDTPYVVQVAVDIVNTLDTNFTSLPAQDVSVTNADDDTAGFTLDKTTLATTEAGGTDTFTVVLDAQPSADVVFIITSNDTSEGVPDVSTLTFTPASWDTPQIITVTGADDILIDGDIPYIVQVAIDATNTLDTDYISLPVQDVNAINADDDTAGFTLDKMTLSTTEAGGTDAFTVVLNVQPSADVVFTISSNDTSEGTPDVSALTFTSVNWDTPQMVTITGADDILIDGDIPYIVQVAIDATNTLDTEYAPLPAQDVSAINADDDTAGFTLSPTSASVIEGESTSYDIVLDAPPSADVVIDLTSSNPDVTAPTSVTFTPSDWNTPQTITLTTLDNLLIDGTRIATITHDVTSADSAYDVLPTQDFTLTIGDNDSAGILIDTPVTTVDEGDSLTYNVRLTSQPTADVIIAVTSLNSEAIPDTTTLTFTPTDWNIPQDVVLTVADNTTPEADRLADVVHSISSADSAYDALPDQTPIFNIVDNDAPITPSPEATEIVPTDVPTETDGDAVWDIQLDAVPTLLIDGQTVTFTMTVRKLSGGYACACRIAFIRWLRD